jgi:glutaredoxin
LAEVVLYTKQHDCAPCVEAKQFLSNHGIDFIEKDVEVRENLQELVKQYHLMTVPVLVVDSKPVKGFERSEYLRALGLAGD